MIDSGTSDIYVCSRCERQIPEAESARNDEFAEAFEHHCDQCAAELRAEMDEA